MTCVYLERALLQSPAFQHTACFFCTPHEYRFLAFLDRLPVLIRRVIGTHYLELVRDIFCSRKRQGYSLFCRVYGFGARVYGSLTELPEVSGTCRVYGSVTDLKKVPGIVPRAYRTHRSSAPARKMLYPHPGYCGTYRTYRSSSYGYMNVMRNSQKFQVLCT